MEISCAFAPSMDTPAHTALAESLGYRRAWFYDSPAFYPDVWVTMALAAERTNRIGLGPAVLVPSLRHPMVNAAAIAGLAAQAPGRVAVAVGSGFTGRMGFGQRPMKWSDVGEYVRVLMGLLRGEDAEWEGKTIRMLQLPGFGAARPVDVPFLLAASGPKGLALVEELGTGVFSAAVPTACDVDWHTFLCFGTVIDEGEEPTSARVREAAGPGLVVALHGTYESSGAAVDGFPGGAAWREAVERTPPNARHLAIHEGHLVALNDRDRLAIDEMAPLVTAIGVSGTAKEVRDKLKGIEDAGVTEIAYQPSGPDIPRELRAFIDAAAG